MKAVTVINLVTPEAAAKCELLFNKSTSKTSAYLFMYPNALFVVAINPPL
jgi:hypothetical protein